MVEGKAPVALNNLIALLRDGEKGFQDLAERIESPECRDFLLEEAILRGAYADQLERSVNQAFGDDLHPPGTRLGAAHRQWTALKAALGAGDYALLEATELCEWFAVKAYKEALREKDLPDAVRDIAVGQARSVHQSREIVREFRRMTKL